MDDTEPGQTRLLTYAIDLAVDAEAKTEPPTAHDLVLGDHRAGRLASPAAHAPADDALHVQEPRPGAAHGCRRTPSHLGEIDRAGVPDERTAQGLRFDVPVPAGGGFGFTVREEQEGRQAWPCSGTAGTSGAFTQLGQANAGPGRAARPPQEVGVGGERPGVDAIAAGKKRSRGGRRVSARTCRPWNTNPTSTNATSAKWTPRRPRSRTCRHDRRRCAANRRTRKRP